MYAIINVLYFARCLHSFPRWYSKNYWGSVEVRAAKLYEPSNKSVLLHITIIYIIYYMLKLEILIFIYGK